MYTSIEIDEMLLTVYKAPLELKTSFMDYVISHTNLGDSGSINRCISEGYMGCEVFERFDSDVCEQFIGFYEDTFGNKDWMEVHDVSIDNISKRKSR